MYRCEDSADEDLIRRVRLSVDRSRQHGLRLIDIEVVGDAVVLSGQVVTFHQKQLATAFARRVAGVIQVVNRLEVQDTGPIGRPERRSMICRQPADARS